MNKISTFQVVLLAVFLFLAAAGVFVFATFGNIGGDSVNKVVIWGTLDQRIMDRHLGTLQREISELSGVSYEYKDPDTYRTELVEALAEGTGPDLFMLTQDSILLEEDKIVKVPYDRFSERDFKDIYIEEGELLLSDEGIIALPYIVDPFILYWNRDLFSRAGLSQPPRYWDELFTSAPLLTKKDDANNIVQSVAALGEYANITHAKEILITLFLQAGTPIVDRNEKGELTSKLRDRLGFATIPSEAALRFYTEFSNPVNATYSWNRALPESRKAFLAGDLALYVAPASEAPILRELNPNLNFDVAVLPQSRGNEDQITFGKLTGLAISKQSQNVGGAFQAAVILTGAPALNLLEEEIGLPPVRRDLLSTVPTDSYGSVSYRSALLADAFLDPNPQETDKAFKEMVEAITSGKELLSSAVSVADRQLNNLLKAR